jgi:hypothetical protein
MRGYKFNSYHKLYWLIYDHFIRYYERNFTGIKIIKSLLKQKIPAVLDFDFLCKDQFIEIFNDLKINEGTILPKTKYENIIKSDDSNKNDKLKHWIFKSIKDGIFHFANYNEEKLISVKKITFEIKKIDNELHAYGRAVLEYILPKKNILSARKSARFVINPSEYMITENGWSNSEF